MVKQEADKGCLDTASLNRMIPMFVPPGVPVAIENGFFHLQQGQGSVLIPASPFFRREQMTVLTLDSIASVFAQKRLLRDCQFRLRPNQSDWIKVSF